MNINLIKLIPSVFIAALFLLISLPEFSTEVFGQKFELDRLSFEELGIDAEYKSFTKDPSIFPATELTYHINFDEEITNEEKENIQDDILETLKTRLTYKSRFSDIEVVAVKENTQNYGFVFTVPEKYNDPEFLINALTNKGIFQIELTNNTTDISFTENDIESIFLKSRARVNVAENSNVTIEGEHLLFQFSSDKQEQVESIINSGFGQQNSASASFIIDGVVFPVDPIRSTDNGLAITNPEDPEFFLGVSRENQANYFSAVQSYFQNEEIDKEITFESSRTVAPKFTENGASQIAYAASAGFILIYLVVLARFPIGKAISFILYTSTLILGMITIAKIFALPLGVFSIFGLLTGSYIAIFLGFRLLSQTGAEEIGIFASEQRKLFIAIAAGLYILINFAVNINLQLFALEQLLIPIFSISFVGGVLSFLNLNHIINFADEYKSITLRNLIKK